MKEEELSIKLLTNIDTIESVLVNKVREGLDEYGPVMGISYIRTGSPIWYQWPFPTHPSGDHIILIKERPPEVPRTRPSTNTL